MTTSLDRAYSPETYRELCSSLIITGYRFGSFAEISPLIETAETPIFEPGVCFIRHDVDAEPLAALGLGMLEANIGVKSTFFWMTRSPLYNLFGRRVSNIVRELVGMGHEFGIHYDHAHDLARGLSPDESGVELAAQISFIEHDLGVSVSAVSFHQPSVTTCSGIPIPKGIASTYDLRLQQNLKYFSDSNRELDFVELRKWLSSRHAFQLLIHPMWWMYPHANPMSIWRNVVSDSFKVIEGQLIETERTYRGPLLM